MNNEPDYDNLYFEEKKMQKTPEVGDVWVKKGSRYKFIITNLGTKDNTWISRLWSNGFADSFPPATHLEYYHRYMGNFKISKFAEMELDNAVF